MVLYSRQQSSSPYNYYFSCPEGVCGTCSGPVGEISRMGKCSSMKTFQLRKGVCLAGITVVSM